MKTIQMKRVEALIRLENSQYRDSKAARNGVSEETWQKNKDREIARLNKLTGGND